MRRYRNDGPLTIYLSQIRETELLSRDDERSLLAKAKEGDKEAYKHLVRANLCLVVSIATGYMGRGLPLEDLVGEGNLGLFLAINNFDVSYETKFATYATYWIKRFITMAITRMSGPNGLPIRLPVSAWLRMKKYKQARQALAQRAPGCHIDPAEVFAVLGLNKQSQEGMRKTLAAFAAVRITDGGVDGHHLDEELCATSDTASDEDFEPKDIERVRSKLARLPERDALVLRKRFGIECSKQTLAEIGRELKVTKERVRQIESKAIRRLRGMMT